MLRRAPPFRQPRESRECLMHSRSALGENRGEETAVSVRLRRLLSHVPLTVRPKVCRRSLRPGLAAPYVILRSKATKNLQVKLQEDPSLVPCGYFAQDDRRVRNDRTKGDIYGLHFLQDRERGDPVEHSV